MRKEHIMRILALIFISLLLTFYASSQTRYKLPCDTAKTTLEGRICASEELKKAEQELDESFGLLIKKIHRFIAANEEEKANEKKIENLLIISQHKWEEYLESVKELHGQLAEGGTASSEIILTIATILTRERLLEIKDLLLKYQYW